MYCTVSTWYTAVDCRRLVGHKHQSSPAQPLKTFQGAGIERHKYIVPQEMDPAWYTPYNMQDNTHTLGTSFRVDFNRNKKGTRDENIGCLLEILRRDISPYRRFCSAFAPSRLSIKSASRLVREDVLSLRVTRYQVYAHIHHGTCSNKTISV